MPELSGAGLVLCIWYLVFSMESHFFISVVIPALNEEKYLTRSLSSLRKQDYPREKFETIVADNDSTDATAAIADNYGAKVVRVSEKGVAAVRQAGSEVARGEIIAGTDADTQLPDSWLSTINTTFQKNSEVVALTGGAHFDSKSLLNRVLAEYFFPLLMNAMFLVGKKALNGFNFAVRADAFREVGGFNKNLISAEDVDLGMRLAKMGKVVFVPNLMVLTSSRRIDAGRMKFFGHHLSNIINFMILGRQPKSFDNIR